MPLSYLDFPSNVSSVMSSNISSFEFFYNNNSVMWVFALEALTGSINKCARFLKLKEKSGGDGT
jgi:hypothetical protein